MSILFTKFFTIKKCLYHIVKTNINNFSDKIMIVRIGQANWLANINPTKQTQQNVIIITQNVKSPTTLPPVAAPSLFLPHPSPPTISWGPQASCRTLGGGGGGTEGPHHWARRAPRLQPKAAALCRSQKKAARRAAIFLVMVKQERGSYKQHLSSSYRVQRQIGVSGAVSGEFLRMVVVFFRQGLPDYLCVPWFPAMFSDLQRRLSALLMRLLRVPQSVSAVGSLECLKQTTLHRKFDLVTSLLCFTSQKRLTLVFDSRRS